MGNIQRLNAAEPPMAPPPVDPVPQSPPTSQSIMAAVSNNPGVFEDLHKKCKGSYFCILLHYTIRLC